MAIRHQVLLILCFHVAQLFLVERQIVSDIWVTNGSRDGNWKQKEFCPPGTFATGFNIKVEKRIYGLFPDNSAMNSVKIICSSGAQITSGEGAYGDWQSTAHCGIRNGKPSYLVSFKLQVEPDQGLGDDSGGNWISFKCRDFDTDNSYQLDVPPGYFHWGSYGSWSGTCPIHSAICGLETRIEDANSLGNTGLNDVKFFCCND